MDVQQCLMLDREMEYLVEITVIEFASGFSAVQLPNLLRSFSATCFPLSTAPSMDAR